MKITDLYDKVKDLEVTMYDTELANTLNASANLTFEKGNDENYGAYHTITHNGTDWGEYSVQFTADNPQNKYVVWYVYNPNNWGMPFTYATTSDIYQTETSMTCELQANGWTRIAIEWTYAYNVDALHFVLGVKAGESTSMTGLKVSATYVVSENALSALE